MRGTLTDSSPQRIEDSSSKEPLVLTWFTILDEAIKALEKRLVELSERLYPILSPPPEKEESQSKIMVSKVPLVDKLGDVTNRVRKLEKQVQDVLNRLEI
jgi:polyhydroxyalkanoate synthesis regulator phasin